jgi:hypothetical protein
MVVRQRGAQRGSLLTRTMFAPPTWAHSRLQLREHRRKTRSPGWATSRTSRVTRSKLRSLRSASYRSNSSWFRRSGGARRRDDRLGCAGIEAGIAALGELPLEQLVFQALPGDETIDSVALEGGYAAAVAAIAALSGLPSTGRRLLLSTRSTARSPSHAPPSRHSQRTQGFAGAPTWAHSSGNA